MDIYQSFEIMEFHFFDKMIMGVYILIIIYIGIIRKRKAESSEESFILSGRRLSITGFVATLVSTWYGAILGVGENTFLYGCLLYTSPSPRDAESSRMPSSA